MFLSTTVAFARTEHNSFLETTASSTSALVSEVQHNATVRTRYERQFMMSKDELVRYFSGLHIEPLTEDRRYLVYNVDDSLVIRSRMLHLTKGTLVFADSLHKPVLKCSCGNPMRAALPALGENDTLIHSLMGGAMVPFIRSAETPGDDEPLFADNDLTMTGEEPTLDDTPEVVDVPASRPEPIVPTSPPISGGPPSTGGLGWFGLVPLFASVPLFYGHNHTPPPPGPPAAIPEPATFVPLALGVTALAWRRRKK